ncbi:hypothetical protein HPB50_023228 [Hyalomma asiaticum]|uniref:Uncharacterized protein n=1 Tax=Hyalomma asiaticum TaxID=266040 RepID=A0ACB7SNP9_HYAAI|nr:hypothetical protein HPB50_023228 [Hyalomma asiaticum]
MVVFAVAFSTHLDRLAFRSDNRECASTKADSHRRRKCAAGRRRNLTSDTHLQKPTWLAASRAPGTATFEIALGSSGIAELQRDSCAKIIPAIRLHHQAPRSVAAVAGNTKICDSSPTAEAKSVHRYLAAGGVDGPDV